MNKELLKAAIDIAKAGGENTLKYFKKNIEILDKADNTPVTLADRETEQVLRDEIKKRYPEHGIIGEEFGRINPESRIQWVLDPIDGTKSFIHGIPFYTTLVAVLIDDEPQVGIIYAPALDELCAAAIGEGVTLNGEACKVRETEQLEDATFLVTEIYRFEDENRQMLFEELLSKTKTHRTWGDAYGHMMVATGRADLMYDPELNIWDAAALLPVVKEAGGIFCDKNGKQSIHSGNGFSTTKKLFPEVIKIFEAHNQ